jgi:hypothetical protein
MKRRRLATVSALTIFALAGIGTGVATGAPGDCPYPPGQRISAIAKTEGANAGPNGAANWNTAPGTPNTPGQEVRNECTP